MILFWFWFASWLGKSQPMCLLLLFRGCISNAHIVFSSYTYTFANPGQTRPAVVEVWPEVLSMGFIGQILNSCVWPELFSLSILRISVVIASEWQRAKELASGLAYPCFIYSTYHETILHEAELSVIIIYLSVYIFNVRSCHLRLTYLRPRKAMHTQNKDREMSSGQTTQFSIWTVQRHGQYLSSTSSDPEFYPTFICLNLTQACSVRPTMLYLTQQLCPHIKVASALPPVYVLCISISVYPLLYPESLLHVLCPSVRSGI
jgi:hypothetical protein